MIILDVKNLKTHFFTGRGVVRAVDGIDFSLEKGEPLGIVGESGCGKSVTALSILRLLPSPPAKIVSGTILFDQAKDNGTIDLTRISEKKMRDLRGKRIAMIFQEPMTALNPVFTIGNQISEAISAHEKVNKKEAGQRVIELLNMVGIPAPKERLKSYPHELSGGMRQRVMIAMAISLRPEILIADEPTTALDVTIQAQILDLLEELKEKFGMAMILITHDMGIIAEAVKKVAIMYSGRIVEKGTVERIFENPLHPYTIGLLKAIPPLDKKKKNEILETIPGTVPDLIDIPKGCLFRDRCRRAQADCAESEPDLLEVEEGHWVRCYHI